MMYNTPLLAEATCDGAMRRLYLGNHSLNAFYIVTFKPLHLTRTWASDNGCVPMVR